MSKYRYFLILVFIAAWSLAAWHPLNQQNWITENIMIFLWVPGIIALGRFYPLSNFSYTLITIYLLFHLVGTHYNYGSVPFGQTLGNWMGENRNQYDRFVHFCFGLLITYPLRELFLKTVTARGFWSYLFPISIAMSFSALYEIFEWIGAIHLPPETGYLFVGGNDPWDSVKDMAIAALGSLVAMGVLVIIEKIRKKL